MEKEICKIRIEDVPENLQVIYEIVGEENFIKILKIYGGSSIYIPLYTTYIKKVRNKRIFEEYDGNNLDYLRMKYQISLQQIKRLIEENEYLNSEKIQNKKSKNKK